MGKAELTSGSEEGTSAIHLPNQPDLSKSHRTTLVRQSRPSDFPHVLSSHCWSHHYPSAISTPLRSDPFHHRTDPRVTPTSAIHNRRASTHLQQQPSPDLESSP